MLQAELNWIIIMIFIHVNYHGAATFTSLELNATDIPLVLLPIPSSFLHHEKNISKLVLSNIPTTNANMLVYDIFSQACTSLLCLPLYVI